MPTEVSCVVSGSFTKAKDRIDQAIYTFEGVGFNVRSPMKGGLFFPRENTLWSQGSYPLEAELLLTEAQAKRSHINAISSMRDKVNIAVRESTARVEDPNLIQPKLRSVYSTKDKCFVYFVLTDGVLGHSMLIEAGVGIALGHQLYCDQPIDPKLGLHPNIREQFQVKSPDEVAEIWSSKSRHSLNIWLPKRYFYDIIRNNSSI